MPISAPQVPVQVRFSFLHILDSLTERLNRGYLDFGPENSSDSDFDTSAFKPSPLPKSARSSLEFDIQAYQILNRHILTARPLDPLPPLPPFPLNNDFTNPSPNSNSTPDLKSTPDPLVHSIRELWDAERARRASLGLAPTPVLPSDPTSSQRGVGGEGNWEASARFHTDLKERMEREREEGGWKAREEVEEWERMAWTAFESTEMLWGSEWRTLRPRGEVSLPLPRGGGGDGEVHMTPKDENASSPHPHVHRAQPPHSSSQLQQLASSSSDNPFESSADTGEDDSVMPRTRTRTRTTMAKPTPAPPTSTNGKYPSMLSSSSSSNFSDFPDFNGDFDTGVNLSILSSQAVTAAMEQETLFQQTDLLLPGPSGGTEAGARGTLPNSPVSSQNGSGGTPTRSSTLQTKSGSVTPQKRRARFDNPFNTPTKFRPGPPPAGSNPDLNSKSDDVFNGGDQHQHHHRPNGLFLDRLV